MQEESEKPEKDKTDENDDRSLSGFSQFIVGELETIGGVLTGDPLTQAEGEFNVEVGTVRGELEEDLEDRRDEE